MMTFGALQWSAAMVGFFFIFALGAVVGSFINVLVYRLPRGLSVVSPPSACPACGTHLRWTQNLPVLGWLMLRGRCRFCKSRISPEYPLVEFAVGLLFATLFAMWFMHPSIFSLAGADASALRTLRPEWAEEGLGRMWPMLAVIFVLISSLVAMTLIDLRTYTIPPMLPWVVMAVSIAIHPLHALWIERTLGDLRRSTHYWTIPTPNWPWLGVAIGGSAGLVIATILLWKSVIPRSFEDYEEWESAQEERERADKAASHDNADAKDAASNNPGVGGLLMRTLLLTGPAIALMSIGFTIGLKFDAPMRGMGMGMAIGLLIGMLLRKMAPEDGGDDEGPIWIQYPHARREMVKELLFLTPCLALAVVGWWIGRSMGRPSGLDPVTGRMIWEAGQPPLWLAALGGSLLGLLAGGGIVWLFRIFGTLAFGKEAMGLGDVHLLAAVGAALGWIDPVLAFFLAPFFGIVWAMLGAVSTNLFKRQGQALPYGPHLALATLVLIYAKPAVELALGLLAHRPIDIP